MREILAQIDDLDVTSFSRGDILLTEGEITSKVFILKDGNVAISVNDEEVCKVCTPGSVFGEVSALLDMENSATVNAVEATSVWVVEDFAAFAGDNPDFTFSIARELAQRLNNMNLNFLELRVALNDLNETHREQVLNGATMPLTREEVDRMKEKYADKAPEQSDLSESLEAPIVVSGLVQKVDELLHKRIF